VSYQVEQAVLDRSLPDLHQFPPLLQIHCPLTHKPDLLERGSASFSEKTEIVPKSFERKVDPSEIEIEQAVCTGMAVGKGEGQIPVAGLVEPRGLRIEKGQPGESKGQRQQARG